MAADSTAAVLDWGTLTALAARIAADAMISGRPEVIVGVLRGGIIPAVLIAHELAVRDVRAIAVRYPTAEGVNAVKTPEPRTTHAGWVGDLSGSDVLLVDDDVGSGDAIRLATLSLLRFGAVRVRTAACVVNDVN